MILCLLLTCANPGTAALPSLGVGVQAGLALPVSNELKATAGTGLNLDLGCHVDWAINGRHSLRPRLDLLAFSQGHQQVAAPVQQRLDTKVQGLAMGSDYLYRFSGQDERWAAGAGVHLLRWSVDSTNQVTTPKGVARASSTSRWTRGGLSLVATCRLTPQLEVEGRWLASRYGYENVPVRMGIVALLWHF